MPRKFRSHQAFSSSSSHAFTSRPHVLEGRAQEPKCIQLPWSLSDDGAQARHKERPKKSQGEVRPHFTQPPKGLGWAPLAGLDSQNRGAGGGLPPCAGVLPLCPLDPQDSLHKGYRGPAPEAPWHFPHIDLALELAF